MVRTNNHRQLLLFDPWDDLSPKRKAILRYTKKSVRLAKRRSIEQSDQFKDRYRWRAGLEATMSEYDK